MKKLFTILMLCQYCLAATFYVEPDGDGAVSASNQADPSSLNAAWDAIGTTIANGDTIIFDKNGADSTFDTATDLGNLTTGLGALSGLGALGVTFDFNDCTVDFSGMAANVEGFKFDGSGAWIFKDGTIRDCDPDATEAVIDVNLTGSLKLYNMNFSNDRTATNGSFISMVNRDESIEFQAYNCDFSGYCSDAIDYTGAYYVAEANKADRIFRFYHCDFHDVYGTGSADQCFTMHGGGYCYFYFCNFENLSCAGGIQYAIGHGSAGTNYTAAYSCKFTDCEGGIGGTNGGCDIANCEFENITEAACISGEGTASENWDIRNCKMWNVDCPAINTVNNGIGTVESCLLVTNETSEQSAGLKFGNGTSEFTGTVNLFNSVYIDRSTYTGSSNAEILRFTCANLNIKNCLLYTSNRNMRYGHIYYTAGSASQNIFVTVENSIIRIPTGTQIGEYIFREGTSGTPTLTLRGNTYATPVTGLALNAGTAWTTTQDAIMKNPVSNNNFGIENFVSEILLRNDSVFWKENSAKLFPGWYKPTSDNLGVYTPYKVGGDGNGNYRSRY
jgi:hypothetical protein